jgi:hypothetical protein
VDPDIAKYLYAVRNRLAHGKEDALVSDFSRALVAVADDLPIIKLLARLVVERALPRIELQAGILV